MFPGTAIRVRHFVCLVQLQFIGQLVGFVE